MYKYDKGDLIADIWLENCDYPGLVFLNDNKENNMNKQLAKVIKGEVFIYGAGYLDKAVSIGNIELAKALDRYNGHNVEITIKLLEDK